MAVLVVLLWSSACGGLGSQPADSAMHSGPGFQGKVAFRFATRHRSRLRRTHFATHNGLIVQPIRQPEIKSPLEPWRGAGARRYELFKLAAPVFRRNGYRGTTVKALAHACHMSAASLYHYFPSKAALATYPLDVSLPGWDDAAPEPGVDPLVQLRDIIDLAVVQMPDYQLAIELAREIGRPMGQRELAGRFGAGVAVFGRPIAEATPGYSRADAEALALTVVAVLVAPYATGLDPDPRATRGRIVALLRSHLLAAGVDAGQFDAAMAGA